MNNTGSFGAATGGLTPELQAAIQRRAGGNPSGAMGQLTNSAPTANPATQVPGSVSAPQNPQTNLASGGAGMGTGTTEAKIIIQALKGRLDALNKAQVF